jgi:aspartate carbamoyltransferase catalytic subunit
MNHHTGRKNKPARGSLNAKRFEGRDVISILDFSRVDLEYLFRTAENMRRFVKGRTNLLSDRVMASLFFEPSTRTRLSFEAAMNRLGGTVIGFSEPGVSSIAKGETLEDTIRMTDGYADLIVIRHPREGSAQIAADVASVPVINAGDGSQHHPTQAMIDLYTIWREFGEIDGLHAAIVGDLKHGRAAASFAYGVSKFKNVKLSLVSPNSLKAKKEVMDYLSSNNVPVTENENLEDATRQADIIYVTRIQKERFADPAEYERVKGSYVLDLHSIAKAKNGMIILHPLPRVDELAVEVDSSPHARYFEQAKNGVPLRMALLALVLGKTRQ